MEPIILAEFCDKTDFVNEIVVTGAMCIQTNMQLLHCECATQNEDVYVGNFYEAVVPHYSDATFKKYFRISRKTMSILYDDLRSQLSDETFKAMTVPLGKKIHVTLWLLANHAISFRAASDLFGLSKGTAHLIFLQICHLISNLKNKYIRWPNEQTNNENAAFVLHTFGLPGVVGFIDGCHIPIKAPSHNPADFYNRKKFHSVVLQGVCDSQLRFIDVFIGMTGRVHDARIFKNSPLYREISNGLIPANQHILGDSAYPLMMNVLTPYRNNGFLNRFQIKYNKKHSGARSAIERAFGRLKGKFRRLMYLDMSLSNDIPVVIGACCILHNIILKYDGNTASSDDEAEENLDENDYVRECVRHNDPDAQNKRNIIAQSLIHM